MVCKGQEWLTFRLAGEWRKSCLRKGIEQSRGGGASAGRRGSALVYQRRLPWVAKPVVPLLIAQEATGHESCPIRITVDFKDRHPSVSTNAFSELFRQVCHGALQSSPEHASYLPKSLVVLGEFARFAALQIQFECRV